MACQLSPTLSVRQSLNKHKCSTSYIASSTPCSCHRDIHKPAGHVKDTLAKRVPYLASSWRLHCKLCSPCMYTLHLPGTQHLRRQVPCTVCAPARLAVPSPSPCGHSGQIPPLQQLARTAEGTNPALGGTAAGAMQGCSTA